MRATLGIDVGSTTAKVIVVAPDGGLLFDRCERHRGRGAEVARAFVAEARAAHAIERVAVTGTLGVALATELGAVAVHEVRAVCLAARARHPTARAIVELGGQDAKIVSLDGEGRDDAQMNDRCAAGTGATIDRIAGRLGVGSAQLRAARLAGTLRVAAKCGVFAETDVVNLVKRGASKEEAIAALARAIVVQNLSVLARGRVLRAPVLLLGGPHAHLPVLAEAWRSELTELWSRRGVESGEVFVPDGAELFAAIGAALHASRGGRTLAIVRGVHRGDRRLPRLVEPGDEPDVAALHRAPAAIALPRGVVPVHLGVDAGSTTAKLVALDGEGRLVAHAYGRSGGSPIDDVRARLRELEAIAAAHGASLDVRSLGITGYGAELVAPVLGADATPVETVAHALSARRADPDVQVVVDVGGTDVKVLRLEEERVADFHVSSQCAAGHGAFLALAAEEIGVPMERFAEHALCAERAPRFAVGCAVFLDTDRVTFRRDGYTEDEILAGLAWSLARNVWEHVVPVAPARLGTRFLLTGGAHRNLAVAWAQARYLRERIPGARVRVHPAPELCGAEGAALAALDAVRDGRPTRFVGFAAAAAVRVAVLAGEDTRCTRCEVECARSVVRIEREREAPVERIVGNGCERGADEGSTGRRSRAHAPDLLAVEATRLFRTLLPPPRAASPSAPVIGIPRVMCLYRCAPLLLHYLEGACVPRDHLVLSPPTSEALFHDGSRWGANDPCFPAKLVPAHVDWLLRAHAARRIDYLLMPALPHASIVVRGTTTTASCPIVAACGHTTVAALRTDGDVLGRLGIEPLVPELDLTDRDRLDAQLFATFGPVLGIDRAAHERALAHGVAAQAAFQSRSRASGARLLARARRDGRAVAVVLARPYHADPGVQHGISTELASRGIPVLGISSLPIEDTTLLDLSEMLPDVTNSGCAEKMWAARVVASTPHLVAVDLSSFRCGQDASILGVLGDVLERADRPVLRLHDLDEDRPTATLRVRIATFADAVRRWEARTLAPRGRRRDALVAREGAPS